MQRQTVKHVFEPPVQNIRQFETALHREWQQLSQQDIQCLTGGMRRRIVLHINYSHYFFLF
jgi:hypothetical protein